MKIVTIVGARPQFIKAAAISRALHASPPGRPSLSSPNLKRRVQEILVHTGQHYDTLMDQVFFKELELPKPDYHLGVGSSSHGRQTGIMLEKIEAVLQKEKPGVVLVYGDTNSTLAGALASAKLNLPVAHVEAGLRSYHRTMPEEINRLLTDHLSTFLFCPTEQALRNLWQEGIKDGKTKMVKKVGDVMYDSILYYSKIAEERSTILHDLNLVNPESGIPNPQYYLATVHRAENTDDPTRLGSILKALNVLGREIRVIFPLHPRTRKWIHIHHLQSRCKGVELIEPVSYLDMLMLEKNSKAILTDSGGVQKEAYWFQVPCFTLREETEWVETLRQGWNKLVGFEEERIVQEVSHARGKSLRRMKSERFGNGRASEKIVQLLNRGMN